MKRSWIIALLTAASLAAVYGVAVQHRQLVNLRSEQENRVAQLGADSPETAPSPEIPAADSSRGSVSSELLRLRSEVNRLTQQKQGLMGVSNEHARLKAELASGQSKRGLPEGYIRKKEAKFAGYSTPEQTVESFLWAIQNHDLTNLMQALTPTMAQQMGFMRQERSAEEMFKDMEMMPGMRVVSKRTLTDDSAELEVEMIPGSDTMRLRFHLNNGRWQMSQER